MTTETLPAVRPAPVEVVTPMKPSEAIRLGCLIAPVQSFGDPGVPGYSACVVSALMRGGPRIPIPFLSSECPQCGDEGFGLVHLNDDHRWSRERIADWLEGLGL